MTLEQLYQKAARALCIADGQRHMRLENRTGEPCRVHVSDGYTVVDALKSELKFE